MKKAAVGVVLVCHGGLGEALVAAAERIVGRVEGVRTVSIDSAPEEVSPAREAIQRAIQDVRSPAGVLVLTDMFGGTPSNLSLAFLDEGRVEVVTGVNLPMLIKALAHRDASLPELVRVVRDAGQGSIIVASRMLQEGHQERDRRKPR